MADAVEDKKDEGTLEEQIAIALQDAPAKEGEVPYATELEGKRPKIDPKTHPPEPGTPRWEEIYWKSKEMDRIKKEYEDFKKTTSDQGKLVEELKLHNKRLAEVMEKGVTSIADSVKSNVVVDDVKELDDAIKAAKSERVQALKDVDYDKAEEISDKIDTLRDQIREKKASKVTREASPKAGEPSPDDKVAIEEFISDSKWFNEDPLMRAAATQLDVILANDKEWQGKPIKNRLAEVKSRIEKRFHYESDNGDSPRPKLQASTVDSSTSGVASGKGSSKLNADQETIAKGLGLTNEDYLKQLQMIERGL